MENPLERKTLPKIPTLEKGYGAKLQATALPTNSRFSPLEHPGTECSTLSCKSSPQIVLHILKNPGGLLHSCQLRCGRQNPSVSTTKQTYERAVSAGYSWVKSTRRRYHEDKSMSELQIVLKSSQVNSLQVIRDPEAPLRWFCT